VHLWSHNGGKLVWDEAQAAFRPDANRAPTNHDGKPFVACAGSANGFIHMQDILQDAVSQAKTASLSLGATVPDETAPSATVAEEAPLMPVWLMPENAHDGLRMKAWLDYQNDVKVSDVQLAAREGYESVEHTKRYTTLGMASDQGKLSNINGLATLSNALDTPIPEVGTTTFRPPYHPISFGAMAGDARGSLFQPVRKTPMHEWHEARGAHWEPVGAWRRPYAFPKKGESVHDAVNREINATRQSLGMLDASTLGKIIVKGPDAGRFLDMLYTNMMSTLKPGKCRYGLMCTENGFLTDDGVVARLDEDTFLCHTTTGGADRIHAHMEEWLQTEWWDWKVYTANVTEQWAQIAVVGPNARKLLEKMGGMDVSKETLPFMEWKEGSLGDFPVRIFRISFSGELSYEIATPANHGRALWEMLMYKGEEFNATPYGTEALHVMRAEKGFIMIGDESDGTVIPQDLGLHWAISKKKEDYIGKRAQARAYMDNPDRWQLVGLETLDGSVLPDGIYAVAEGVNANGQKKTQGRVTSTYHSPTLNKGIAMGLVHKGPERMGEVIDFIKDDGVTAVKARIVSPVFYDPEGEKQNV
jgi:sarcosine oxidase subunit alpha